MIARRSSLVVGNSLIGGAFGYIALLAMARYMGDELVGARAYVLSIVFLLGMVARLGFPITHARRLARDDDIPRSNGTYLVIKIGLTALFVLLASTAAWVWFDYLGKPGTDVTEQAIWLGILVVVVKSLRDFLTNTFRGLDMIVQREVTLMVNTVVTIGLTVMAAIAYAYSYGRWSPLPGLSEAIAQMFNVAGPASMAQALAWLIAAYLTGEIVAFVISIGLFVMGRIPIGKPTMAIAREYRRATVPIMFVTVAGLLMRRIDQVMVGFWHDSAALGHYAAATKLTEFVLILANGISVALLPLVARLQQQGKEDEMRQVLGTIERWLSMLIWPVIVVGVVATQPIIHIVLSDAFLPAGSILILLLFHSLLNSLTIPLRTKALGLGQQGFAARVATQALGINILLNIALIPRWAGTGAAASTLAAGAFMMARYRFKAHAWTGHPLWADYLWKHAAAAAGTGALFWIATPILPAVDRFYDLVWLGLGVLGLYIAALALMRGVSLDDWHQFRGLLRARPKDTGGVGKQ